MEDEQPKPRRGVEFCCLAYPLINAGAYLIILEFVFVAGCLIILTTFTPSVVAAVDIIPSWFHLVLLGVGVFGLVLQLLGLITTAKQSTLLFRAYARLNFLTVLLAAIIGAIGTIIIASKQKQATETCTRIYGNPPLDSANGYPIQGFENFAPGQDICNYFVWGQIAAMGGLIVLLFVTQSYFCYCQRAHGQKQRAAVQRKRYHKQTIDGDTSTDVLSRYSVSTLGHERQYSGYYRY